MSKGFGQPPKSESPRIKKYTFTYRSSDEYLNLVKIQALSYEEAFKQFQSFVRDLEFSLRVVANQQIALGGHCDE